MRRAWSNLAYLVIGALFGLGCGSDGTSLNAGRCLTNAEICQFTRGVSTKQQVQAKLGNAQMYVGANAWAYTCQQISGQMVVHNDLVAFNFDEAGVLIDITVLRQGSGASEPPACSS